MSKTFTSKPAVVRNRNPKNRNQEVGTGTIPKTNVNRGRGAMATGGGNLSTGAGRGSLTRNSDAENVQPQEQPLDQRMSNQGCYTMISPNEKKRQEIQRQADQETANYQQYKEQKKVGPLSYVGTAGGGNITQQQARNKLIQDNKNPSMRQRERREGYRAQQKKREEEEIEQKRNKQRELADKNKLRSHQTDAEKKNKWDEDRRRKTDDFLSRLERKPNDRQHESMKELCQLYT
ncbi:epithelial-stromal interaction protein 1-like isoform X2 [Mytilus californianus]|uniref:epithelial-stromal interaction protein 1-like isoform X2 n=1 Tax=Mytilus californianus TaxID=6549 RepID=UPI0022457563|nr:epithelial-stromal interaction protein 1-like isoform X2 [Mytilus californianus]